MKLNYIQSHYYSGQGIVYAGLLGPDGKPTRIMPLGNVSALRLDCSADYFEPSASRNGVLVADRPESYRFAGTFTATLESVSSANLAWVAAQNVKSISRLPAATDVALTGYFGRASYIGRLTGAIAIALGGIPLVAYVNSDTAWDFRHIPETGMVLFNDGQVAPLATLSGSTDGFAVTYTRPIGILSEKLGAWAGRRFSFLRFAGLNGADNNKPVVLDIDKSLVEPAGVLDLIPDNIAAMEMRGAMLPVNGALFRRHTKFHATDVAHAGS